MEIIKIESVPKHSSETAGTNSQEWNIDNLEAGRKLIIDQREIHKQKSKWFKIYQNDQLIFDSHLIH